MPLPRAPTGMGDSMGPALTARRLLAGVAVAGVAAVGVALVSQHVFDMQPCPWCVLQRLIFLAMSALALVGLVWRSTLGSRVVAACLVLLAVSGVASALWQHFVAAASTSCNLTWAEKFLHTLMLDGLAPEIFAPRASCADAAVKLLGVPYEFWSLGLFVAMGTAAWLGAASRQESQGRPGPG